MSITEVASLATVPVILFFVLGLLLGMILGNRLPRRRGKGMSAADSRKSPHYIQGMHAMMTGDPDAAIERLSKVVELSTEPVEVYLALGYLYRRRGQVDRAIRVHQSLLTRAGLNEEERVLALNALGSDFRTGGFMDRALRTFRDALALNPKDAYSLNQLVKLSEDLKEWGDAYDYAVRLQKVQRRKDTRSLSYLLAQKAKQMAEDGHTFRAAWQLRRAVHLLPENMLAYIYLTQIYLKAGKAPRSRRLLEKALREMPYKAYMVLPVLREIYGELNDLEGYLESLWYLGREQHQKRALLQYLKEILELKRHDRLPVVVKDLIRHFGRSRLVQRTLWELLRDGLLDEEVREEIIKEMAESEQMSDPYTCIYCGYKTQEILHRCPNCKEWNSFSDGDG